MLNPAYKYLFLDFETTGLDTTKDEPIQIGILSLNPQGEVVNSFSSLIKPSRQTEELKTIVTYLTQKQQKDLQQAPDIHEIVAQIQPFLQENTILIGHNISFDLTFLQRYTDWSPIYTIDTFLLAKACFHFLPSYALEVIYHHLPSHQTTSQTAHDALDDCKMTAEVFIYCIQRLHTIRHQYAILDYALQNGSGILTKILQRTVKPYKFTNKELFFPPLRKPVTTKKKIIRTKPVDILSAGSNSVSYVGNTTLQELLDSLPRPDHQRVITVAHPPKVQIIKLLLDQLGIVTSSLHDIRIFLPDRVNKFLHKDTFDDAELLFIAKYLSHHQFTHTVMDINSADDYKIFYALTTVKAVETEQVIVCTHKQRYTKEQDLLAGAHILFFDQDRRRHTRGDFLQQPFDPYQFLHYLEQKVYEYTLLDQCVDADIFQAILTAATLFFGVLGAELNTLFTGYAGKSLEIESILTHTRMPKTRNSFVGLDELLHNSLTETHSDHLHLQERWNKLYALLHETIVVNKTMYAGDKRYYSFSAPKSFHTFDEFKEYLSEGNYTFFSTRQSHLPAVFPESKKQRQDLTPLIQTSSTSRKPDKVLDYAIHKKSSLYVLSTRKDISQAIFNYLVTHKLHESYTVLAENITGGIGKILFLAQKSTKPILLIGGYACYFQACAKKIPLAELIPYFYEGKQKDLILQDILFYR